jgi:serine O-acetyltransferase
MHAMTFRRTVYLIKKDMLRRIWCDGNEPSGLRILSVMLSPAGMAVTIFRLQSYFLDLGLYPVSKILAVLNIILYGVEIDPAAQIDEGLVLGNANGIVLHRLVRIGKNCLLMHQNGISPNCTAGFVVMGDNVTVGAGAKIIGVLTIGDHCVIGMNAVVTKSLPPCSVAVGVPARVIKTIDPAAPDSARYGKPAPAQCSAPPAPADAGGFRRTLELIGSDMQHRALIDGKPFSWFSYVKLFLNPALLAVVIFRFQHYCTARGWHLLTGFLAGVNTIFFSVDIAPLAEIGPGFVIAHANGIVIDQHVTIGANCIVTLQNSITAGQQPGRDAGQSRAVLEDNVLVGAGARIAGNIRIGHNSLVGMNAVVTSSAPPCSRLAGIPATIVGRTDEGPTPDEAGQST